MLWKSSATFLKARSVLGGVFRPTVITLLPVNPWLPPVRFPNWSLSQIQRKMNIQPPFIHLSHPTKEDHLSIGRELLCHILCQSVLYTRHRIGNSEAQKVCTHTTFSYGRRPNIVWKGTKYFWRRDQILLQERGWRFRRQIPCCLRFCILRRHKANVGLIFEICKENILF